MKESTKKPSSSAVPAAPRVRRRWSAGVPRFLLSRTEGPRMRRRGRIPWTAQPSVIIVKRGTLAKWILPTPTTAEKELKSSAEGMVRHHIPKWITILDARANSCAWTIAELDCMHSRSTECLSFVNTWNHAKDKEHMKCQEERTELLLLKPRRKPLFIRFRPQNICLNVSSNSIKETKKVAEVEKTYVCDPALEAPSCSSPLSITLVGSHPFLCAFGETWTPPLSRELLSPSSSPR